MFYILIYKKNISFDCCREIPAVIPGLPLIGNLLQLKDKKNISFDCCREIPAVIPGLPLIGNLLQLKDKKIHQIFANWEEIYGPIYSIKVGASTIVVLNNANVVQEMARRHLVTHVLGSGAQRRHHAHRDIMMDYIVCLLQAHAKENPFKPVNFRQIIQTEVFALTLKEALGKDVGSSKYIEGLGETLSRDEILKVLVLDPLSGGTETRRLEVMKTLIEEQHKRISSGEGINCYLDWLMSEGKTLTKTQMSMLIWETIFVGTETSLQTAEWAMYELAKNIKYQDELFSQIQRVCGNSKYTGEQYSEITYLSAVFHETLRKYPPLLIGLPLKYVHEDTQLGGYDIPAGTEVAINIYACNMDKTQWDSPKEWNPERFLDSKHDPKDLYKTMSFGGGKRVCPGALQGLLITSTAISRCMQEFKWSLELAGSEEEDINIAALSPQNLLPILATPRNC
ncbi:hypothetical protein MKX03_003700 [Papaver bracteatum]|nr:hypothetical protein MKX03_003700 [Papaver bracteatum]